MTELYTMFKLNQKVNLNTNLFFEGIKSKFPREVKDRKQFKRITVNQSGDFDYYEGIGDKTIFYSEDNKFFVQFVQFNDNTKTITLNNAYIDSITKYKENIKFILDNLASSTDRLAIDEIFIEYITIIELKNKIVNLSNILSEQNSKSVKSILISFLLDFDNNICSLSLKPNTNDNSCILSIKFTIFPSNSHSIYEQLEIAYKRLASLLYDIVNNVLSLSSLDNVFG
jgi:hypothetical protein